MPQDGFLNINDAKWHKQEKNAEKQSNKKAFFAR
jgi:hypothetical protein